MLKRKYSEALGDKEGPGMIRLKAFPGVHVSAGVMEGVKRLRLSPSWQTIINKYEFNNEEKKEQIKKFIIANPKAPVVKMIKDAYNHGNKWIPRTEFINKYFDKNFAYSRFNKAKTSANDRPKVTLGRSQSIMCRNTVNGQYCRVNPLHVYVYGKLSVVHEANLLLDFSKQAKKMN